MKHDIQKTFNNYLENKNNNSSLYRTKKTKYTTFNIKRQKINGIDKSTVNKFNINDYLLKSINIDNDNNNQKNLNDFYKNHNDKNSEQNFKCDSKLKESSLISDIKNKSKISVLYLGINFNSININNQIGNNSIKQSIRPNSFSFDEKTSIEGTKINMNCFYYYFISKFSKNTGGESISLFNMAFSFYKKKLDIIHLFNIILLIEKISKSRNLNNNT